MKQFSKYRWMRILFLMLVFSFCLLFHGCFWEELQTVQPTVVQNGSQRPLSPTVRALQPTLAQASGLSSSSQSEEQALPSTSIATEPTQSQSDSLPAPTKPSATPYDNWTYAYEAETVRSVISGAQPSPYPNPVVFLTFDDGINPVSTPKILDVLKQEQVHATFFVIGKTLFADQAWILQRIHQEGNALALHSFNHDYSLLYPNRTADPKEIGKQADQALEAMRAILGADFSTRLWRYPGGHMSWNGMEAGDQALADRGLVWIDWNAMGGLADIPQRRPKDVPGVLQYMVDSMRYSPCNSVYVVLLHDTVDKPLIPQALPELIQYFRDRGFVFGVLK